MLAIIALMIGMHATSSLAGPPEPVDTVLKNVALGKPVFVPDWEADRPERITDGTLDTGYVGVGDYLRWIQIDLGKEYDVELIKLWHYYADSRRLKDVIVMLSNDPDFGSGVTIVFNNDTDNSAGFGAGTDAEYAENIAGKSVAFAPAQARYVRLYSGANSNGNNIYNHYHEVEVWAEVPIPTAPPAAPEGLFVDVSATSYIKLSWAYDVDLSYNVYRASTAAGEYVKVNTNNIYAGSYSDTGLEPNTTYYYKISSVNEIGESELSGVLEAATLDYATVAIINAPPIAEKDTLVCIDGAYSTGMNPLGGADDQSGISLYDWNFGDGDSVSGDAYNTVTHMFSTAGNYTITLTVTDFRGISDTASIELTIVDSMTRVQPVAFTSDAINNAIASLSGLPGIVELAEGVYAITDVVNVPSNVTLRGAGSGTILDATDNAVNDTIKIAGDNVRITNLVVKGPGLSKNGIVLYGNKNVLIDNCETYDFEIANSVSYYSSVTLENNYIHDNTRSGLGYGVMVVSGSYAMMRENLFENNRHSVSAGGYGSESGWRTSYDLYNNVFGVSSISTADVAIDAHAGTQGRIRVVNNIFKDHRYSIGFRDGWGEITGNTFENISQYICKFDVPIYSDGVTIPGGGCHDFIVSDNVIINCNVKWRMLYGTGNISINGQNIDGLIPFTGDINVAPKVVDYDVSTQKNTSVSGKVAATDANGDTLSYALGIGAANGAAAVSTDGSWTYTPGADFTGADSFTVIVSDGNGGTAVSVVNIDVLAPPAPTEYTVGFRAFDGANSIGYTQQVVDGGSIDWADVEANYPFYNGNIWSDVLGWIDEATGELMTDLDMPITGDIVLVPVLYPADTALVYLTGPAAAVSGAAPGSGPAEVTYMISARLAPIITGVELEFEVDGGFLSSKSFNALDGFRFFGAGNYGTPIHWRNEGGIWIGKVTLLDLAALGGGSGGGGSGGGTAQSPISGDIGIMDMVFNVVEGVLGPTTVKLNYIKLSSFNGPVDCIVVCGEATTVFEQYYSPFDLNKDGIVDLNDLTFALQYLTVGEGDPDWDIAEAMDYNDSKDIDIGDLILILANYTIPYYS